MSLNLFSLETSSVAELCEGIRKNENGYLCLFCNAEFENKILAKNHLLDCHTVA
jgi:hypothetical protein